MSSTADIVIIGGGLHGASLAFHLAQARAGKIVLLEKRFLASGPTAKSGAMIRPLFTEAPYIQLVLEATRMFAHWDEYVGGSAGFVQHGFLRITNSLDSPVLGGDLDLMKKLGVPFEVLPASDLVQGASTSQYNNNEMGLYLPQGGFADPVLTTLGLARAAQRLGVEIRQGAEVSAIHVERGHLRSVQTDSGLISTPLAVNCSGAWGDRIAAKVGIQLPIEIHRTPTCLFLRPESMPLDGPVLSDGVNRVYLRAMNNTLLRAAHFGWTPDPVDPDAYDETIRRGQLDLLRQGLQKRYTEMHGSIFFGGFSAIYDMTPDGHPILGSFPEVEGFWSNCGWSGNGFASAPAVGRCLAQLILGAESDIDLSIFNWPRPFQVPKRPDIKWVFR